MSTNDTTNDPTADDEHPAPEQEQDAEAPAVVMVAEDMEIVLGPDGNPLWYGLADAELLGMLLRRGAEAVSSKGWIATKHLDESKECISEYLDREYTDHEGKVIRLEIPLDRRSRR